MRKGISLVALVITIIVLIILTAAVFLTGADVPQNAELAVFLNDVGNVQDAVTLKIANNIADKYDPTVDDDARNLMTKFDGIVDVDTDAEEDGKFDIAYGIVVEEVDTDKVATIQIDDADPVPVWTIKASAASLGLSIPQEELEKYVIDANGTVYYYNGGTGRYIDGVTYYKNAVMADGAVAETTTVQAVTSLAEEEAEG